MTLNRQVGNISIGGFSSGGAQSVDVSLSGGTLTVNVDGHSDSVDISSSIYPLKGTLDISQTPIYLDYWYGDASETTSLISFNYFDYRNDSLSLGSNFVVADISYRSSTTRRNSSGLCYFKNYESQDITNIFKNSGVSFYGENSGTISINGTLYSTDSGCGTPNDTANASWDIRIINGDIFSIKTNSVSRPMYVMNATKNYTLGFKPTSITISY